MEVTGRKMKQIVAMIFLSVIGAVVLIVHGVLLDLNWSQIYRLSLGGFLVTMPAIFIALLTLEWVFDLA